MDRHMMLQFGRSRRHSPFAGARTLAVERQPHAYARADADTAVDGDVAAVQTDQAFDDGQPETCAVVAALVRRPRLEVWLADAREIFIADADAVVLDQEGDASASARAPIVTLPPRSVKRMALESRFSNI